MRAFVPMYEPVKRKPQSANLKKNAHWVCPHCHNINYIDDTLKDGDWDDCQKCFERVRLYT